MATTAQFKMKRVSVNASSATLNVEAVRAAFGLAVAAGGPPNDENPAGTYASLMHVPGTAFFTIVDVELARPAGIQGETDEDAITRGTLRFRTDFPCTQEGGEYLYPRSISNPDVVGVNNIPGDMALARLFAKISLLLTRQDTKIQAFGLAQSLIGRTFLLIRKDEMVTAEARREGRAPRKFRGLMEIELDTNANVASPTNLQESMAFIGRVYDEDKMVFVDDPDFQMPTVVEEAPVEEAETVEAVEEAPASTATKAKGSSRKKNDK